MTDMQVGHRLSTIVHRYAARTPTGEVARCTIRTTGGPVVSKVIYPSYETASDAVAEMRAVPGIAPAWVYSCDAAPHYHHTTRPRTEPSPPIVVQVPPGIRYNFDRRRRYRRKCGVAQALLDLPGPHVQVTDLAQALRWPLATTQSGNPGSTVLADLLCAFHQSGMVIYRRGADTITVIDHDAVGALARSVTQLGPACPGEQP